MFSRVRIAIRFFFVGLAVGVLLAPRSGEATRRLVREKADRLLNDILDAATLGTVATGTGEAASTDDDLEAEADAPRRTTRSTNGGRSRSRATSTTAPTTAPTS
jgi:gas vesicle protein